MFQVQLVFDSLLPLAIGLAPFFIYEWYNQDFDHPTYTNRQILLANAALALDYFGQALYALALKYGRAGRVQAIESFQGIPCIVLAIILLGQMPNWLEDIGLGLALLGLLLIAL